MRAWHRGKMTDTQLDQLLKAANSELLEHIEATTDPGRGLSELLTRSERYQAIPRADSHVRRVIASSPAAVIINLRILTGDLADLLNAELATTNPVLRDAMLEVSIGLSRALTRDIASALDRGIVNSGVLQAANALTHAIAGAKNSAAKAELSVAVAGGAVSLRLLAAALKVDASGADLSDLKISSLEPLDGTIWTRETTWPPGIAAQVETHSDEIRPGVYQVRLGNTRERHPLTLI